MARKIEIEIVGDAKNFQNSLGKAAGSADSFGSSLARMGKLAAIAIGAAGIGGIAIVLKQGIAEFAQAAKVGAQTNAVLASTGGIANVTAGEVSKLASALMAKSGVDDEAIQSGENMLLTFTKVRNEVGAGNDIFNQGTKAALDLSVALGKDMPAAAMLVGKALNDPIKGMTALTRAGIQFTDEQKKTIAALVKTGDTMGAQKIILKELTTQFGGSAEALGKTLPGQLNILKETFNNLAGTMVGALVPAFTKVVEGASRFLTKFGEADGASAKFGVAMDAIKSLASDAADGLVKVFNKIDWSKTWDGLVASAGTVATRLRDALDQKLGAVDWGGVGKKIADGVTNAIQTVGAVGKKIGETITTSMHAIDWVGVGRVAGPGLAAALVTAFATIMDVSFWIKNWDLALAVGLAMFGKGIGKLVAPMGVALKGMLSKTWDDAVLAITGAIERWFPKIASVLAGVLNRLPGIVVAGIAKLISPVTAGFAKLSSLAQFTVKVLGITTAINAIAQFVQAVIGKLADLVTGAILGGYEIGKGIVQGILNGLASLAGAVYAKAKEIAQGAVNAAKGFLGIGSPSTVFVGIGADTIRGFILGITAQQPALEGKMKEAVSKALDAAKETVGRYQAVFADAFGKLGDYAKRAFDAKTQNILDNVAKKFDAQIAKWQKFADALTPAEKALAAMDSAEAQRSRDAATRAAGDALVQAQAMEEGVEKQRAVAAAEEQIRQAAMDVRRAQLEAQAAVERAAQEAQAAEHIAKLEATKARELQNLEERRRQLGEQLDAQLAVLSARLAKHPEEYAKIQKQIMTLLASYGIPMQKAGENLGKAFARGIRDSIDDAVAAAKALAKAVAQYMPHSPAEKGPLSKPIDWAGYLTSSLPGRGSLAAAASRMAGGMVAGPSMAMAGAGGGGGGRSGGGIVVNLNGPFYGDERGLQQLTDKIGREIQRRSGRNG